MANIPRWAEDVEDLQSYIATAQCRALNIPSTAGTGEGIHIGIIDSAHALPDYLTDEYNVNQGKENSFVESEDYNPHCHHVFNQLSAIAPNSEYSLYQAIDSDGKLSLGPYADAISKALDDGCDIINLSAGDPWRGPIQANPNVSETQRLLDNNVTVVAAAGNYYPDRQDTKPPVHCPSATEGVVSVAGFLTECNREPGKESEEDKNGPYYIYQDNCDEVESVETYCGEQGCIDGDSCITNQIEKPWGRNPMPTGNKPDVLAPMHIIDSVGDSAPSLASGTSFAAPLVTGSLACIFSELREIGKDLPSSSTVQNAVRRTARGINSVRVGKYDAFSVRQHFEVI